MQHIDFFFISSFTKDNVLYTTSYDDGSSGNQDGIVSAMVVEFRELCMP